MQSSDFDKIAKAAAKEVSDTYAVPTYLSASEIKAILTKIQQASDEHTAGK
ncbi:hypothetical protein [Psychrobacter sp. WY6]|nr:hypothetical protein [Psychrobacter sp. WY6]